jgi:hypothetical protein
MGRWWLAEDDRELWQLAHNAAVSTDNETAERQYGIFERYALYGDEAGGGMLPDYIPRRRTERMAHNVIGGIADTIVTEITQTQPRPLFYTAGGTYRQRKDAERLTSACDCKFEAEAMETLGPDVLLDAVLAGTGFFSVAIEHDEVRFQRLFPPDVIMDDTRCVGVLPRSLYIRRYVDKDHLYELYEDDEQRLAIVSAGTGTNGSLWAPFIRRRDIVETYECWHLPSKPGADDGMRCLVISGCLLEREKWERDSYPIIPVRCLLPRIGFWGVPPIARAEPDQQELNKYARRTQEGAHRISVPRVFAKPGTITKSHINNTIGTIVEYTGQTPPKFETPQVFPPEHYQQMERHKRWAHEAVGISELSVSSQIPAGMASASGRAQQIYRTHQKRRLVSMDRMYGAAHCRVAEEWVHAEGRLAKDGKREAEYERNGRREKKPWSELSKDVEAMRIKLAPTSALAKEPAAQMEGIVELAEKNIITPPQALRMQKIPDLQAIKDQETAVYERMEAMFQDMLEGGDYVPPDPFQPVDPGGGALGQVICMQMIALGILQGAEETDLAKLRTWFEHSTSPNLGVQSPEPEPAAGPPGEPPLPPELLPGAPGQGAPPPGMPLPPAGPAPPMMPPGGAMPPAPTGGLPA